MNEIMKNMGKVAFGAVLAGVLGLSTASVQAANDTNPPVIIVKGHGQGNFVDPNAPNAFGYGGNTVYNINAKIYYAESNRVEGSFLMNDGGNRSVNGDFTEVLGIDRFDGRGDIHGDRVMLKGTANVIDHVRSTITNMPFCVEIRATPSGLAFQDPKDVGGLSEFSSLFYADPITLLGGPSCLNLDDGFDRVIPFSGTLGIQWPAYPEPGIWVDAWFDRVAINPIAPAPCQ